MFVVITMHVYFPLMNSTFGKQLLLFTQMIGQPSISIVTINEFMKDESTHTTEMSHGKRWRGNFLFGDVKL